MSETPELEKAQQEAARWRMFYERLQERVEHRKGRRMSIMEHISDTALDPLPFLADCIADLRVWRGNEPHDPDTHSGTSQRQHWIDHAIYICEQVERQVARLNIENEELRAAVDPVHLPTLEKAIEAVTDDVVIKALEARRRARDQMVEALATSDVDAMSEVARQGRAAMKAVFVAALDALRPTLEERQ